VPKSSRFGSKKSPGTVTVIEARVHRSWARNAKIAGVGVSLVAGALALMVASRWMPPALSLPLGVLVGVVCGGVAWAVVRVWPIVRIGWWWAPELGVTAIVFGSWLLLNRAPFTVLVIVVALLAGSAMFPQVRRHAVAVFWCFAVRHRLRVCFSQFIVSNQSGSLPLILLARPTPVGERVWIYLRPGLSPSDLESRLDKIAVACHAASVTVDRASRRTAGLVRIDVKRREALTGTVISPLAGGEAVSPAPASVETGTDPKGLDLPDVTAPVRAAEVPVVAVKPRTSAPAVPAKSIPAVVNGSGEDLSDWID
jgi:hypothetical protein